MPKRLIINADDFNLTPACDLAIYAAFDQGAVTSASCMVWPGLRTPMLASSVPCGVHLRLTGGAPVLGAAAVPSLVDEDGMFPTSRAGAAAKIPAMAEVELEWRAQIELFRSYGLEPTHLDAHHHVHGLFDLWVVYEALCKEYGAAGVPLSDVQRHRLRAMGVPCADHTEVNWTDGNRATLERLLLDDFRQCDTVHLMTHPGFVDADLRRASTMVDVRRAEFDVLTSPEFAVWLRRNEIERVGMSALSPASALERIDILYCAWNRAEFTRASFDALIENTDWSRVRNLWIYDDGSTDGTAAILDEVFERRLAVAAAHICRPAAKQIGPVGAMNHFIEHRQPLAWFAKIDNDVVVPPGWLPACQKILLKHPSVDLLGIEAIYLPLPGVPPSNIIECSHIGGIGLMRTSAFRLAGLPVAAGRMGFSDWQIHHDVVKAWLSPGLPVILLDRLPFEPWASLSARYEAIGWQRPWKRYTAADAALWTWWAGGKRC